jgi:hypothetical protein
MKTYEEGLSKNKSWMSLISCSCFTILTIELIVLNIKVVSWKLWIKLLLTMWWHPQPTTHCLPWKEVIGI